MQKRKRDASSPYYDINEKPVFDSKDINRILPHADPFVFVDKIIEISPKHIVGVKNVTITEYFFKGHFPNNPVMPGVLQIEAMAQVGGIMILSDLENAENYSTLFMKIENARFKAQVVPGDTMLIKMELTAPVRRGICMMKGQIFVGNRVVTEAELMAQIVKQK